MRELTTDELDLVAGGYKCTPADANNTYYGIQNTSSFGQDLIDIYEGVVFATSHVIERVANAFSN